VVALFLRLGQQGEHLQVQSKPSQAPLLQGFEQALAEAIAANGGKGLRAPPVTEVKRMLDAVSEVKLLLPYQH